jgi:hypothetical protein
MMHTLVFAGLVLLVVVVVIYGAYAFARARSDFDEMISPPDDLRRADDGYRSSLAERDGTGGFI